MLEELLAESTEVDYKQKLEEKRPKSWLKSVSAFANGIGGLLLFGVADDHTICGLSDVQHDAEKISQFIKARISPLPEFVLKPKKSEDGKDVLILDVKQGMNTPYYYTADGMHQAFIRMGNESILVPDHILNELILKGSNRTYDSIVTDYNKNDYSFTLLEATYLERTSTRLGSSDYVSFGLMTKDNILTRAGESMKKSL